MVVETYDDNHCLKMAAAWQSPFVKELSVPDNPNIRGPEDPTKVNVNQKHEVDYWTKKWNITEQQLRDAVRKVGVQVKDIQKHLGK